MNRLSGSWRMLFLRFKSLFLKAMTTLKGAIQRNSLIIKATTLTFFIILSLAIVFTVIVFSAAPEFSDQLSSLAQTALNYEGIPPPFTAKLFSYIFLNNIGHFWNPIRMLVWIPLLGPLLLALEILLNSGIIGTIAVIVGINRGVAYPIIGLVPHGIIEIPAVLLQFASIILWQVTITEAMLAKLKGRKVERDKVKRGLKDALILAVASILLFLIAAAIETYVTPYLLGM
jgi:stage II sporulation protein M